MPEQMRFEVFIGLDGKVETHVLERGGQVCSAIRVLTNSLGGRQLNDEETGPEGDTVQETQV